MAPAADYANGEVWSQTQPPHRRDITPVRQNMADHFGRYGAGRGRARREHPRGQADRANPRGYGGVIAVVGSIKHGRRFPSRATPFNEFEDQVQYHLVGLLNGRAAYTIHHDDMIAQREEFSTIFAQ